MTAYLLAFTAFSMTALLCFAGLRAWRGWLDLKRFELSRSDRPQADAADAPSDTGVRIEVADLKERLRKLEAIANGVEL